MGRQQTFVRAAAAVLRVALLAAALFAVASVGMRFPAFNAGLRVEDPYGDWRRVSSGALFDLGRYRFELGVAHLDALVADALSDASRFEDPDALIEESVELLKGSLRRAPADAQTWAALALAAALRRDGDLLEAALRRSWALAPHSAAISGLRMTAIVLLQPESLDVAAREALARDVRMMQRRQPRNLAALLDMAPALAALLEREDIINE